MDAQLRPVRLPVQRPFQRQGHALDVLVLVGVAARPVLLMVMIVIGMVVVVVVAVLVVHVAGLAMRRIQELGLELGYLTPDQLMKRADQLGGNEYAAYLRRRAREFGHD